MSRTLALDFFNLAGEYLKALKILDKVYKEKVPDFSQIKTLNDYKKIKEHPGYPLLFDMLNVKLFLSRHSLELILKSFLLHKGVGISDFKKLYHHNIEACYRDAKRMGLGVFKDIEELKVNAFIGELNKHCFDKIYEYPNKLMKAYFHEYIKIIDDIFDYVRKEVSSKKIGEKNS